MTGLPRLLMIFALALAPFAARAETPAEWLLRVMADVCPAADLTGFDAQIALPGSWILDEERRPAQGEPRRITLRLALPSADEMVLERRQAGGQLRQFRASYFTAGADGLTPAMLAIADGGCMIQSAREMRVEGDVWRYMDQLEGDLETLRWTEVLQAPWPEGPAPGGVRVGMVDSGLAYDLPIFRDRLARSGDGQPIGYDYWDMDPYPYDGDVSRGAFLPIRHGTAVASVLAREAPDAALVPYRYPRPDMTRMADLIARAAADGVRVLAVPLGSRRAEDWTAFAEALVAHDMLAIVSAGNDGRDIDATPIYPAALPLDNIVTVTSADGFGKLAEGSNWGATHVDVMVPAENLNIVDFRGASGVASGSSYAVPRVAALAARLLAAEPDLTTAELRARILSRATQSPFERDGILAAGWIPDPLSD